MKHLLCLAVFVLWAGAAHANPQLAQKYSCTACHTADKKMVGPSWQEVGRRYTGDKGAAAKLAARVKAGGAGVWGPVPMPPNPQIGDADLKTLVQWILTQK
ncbi:c-type cytochrome [Crenobacter sp. SG2305]|uniref:c-type cytochrome n=1 Tax=Crenobacter oryzisoli TaxID=3056844 RepID=UPI0025AAE920|nr:c-type cytochrome [Crenobacter sp. SG2305]MDN0081331.1 c-type cytochrome [Crenobacter sp. SG2305]